MATDKLINSTQGDDIVTKLNLIATKIQAINHDVTIPSNQVTAMTGYSKPASTSAIVVGDTLNQAIGKLEKKADNNQSNISSVQNKTSSMGTAGTGYIVVNSNRIYVGDTEPTGTIPEGSIWINTAVI